MVGRLGVVLVVASIVAGCAGTPPPPRVADEDFPRGGRFTIIALSNGTLEAQFVGTTVFTNAQHSVPADHGLMEFVRDLILERMECDNCEYVPTDAIIPSPLRRYQVSSFDGSVSEWWQQPGDRERAQEAEAEVRRIIAENDLDFVVLLREAGVRDYISNTNQALRGFGVRTRMEMGVRRNISAYAAYEITVRRTPTPEPPYVARWGRGFSVNILDTDERWLDIARDEAPSADALMAFVPDIKEAIAEDNDFMRALCAATLLPDPVDVRGMSLYSRCGRKYRR